MESDYQEMEKKWSVRPVVDEDLPQIISIETKVHAQPWSEQHFLEEWKKPYSQTLVITDDETDEILSGYLVYWELTKDWEILNLAVSQDFRGIGLGKYLLQRLIQKAFLEMAESIFLNVRKGNLPVIRLYQAQGFKIEALRPKFYSNGEDAYQMRFACVKSSAIV